jgi:hypothetical protein
MDENNPDITSLTNYIVELKSQIGYLEELLKIKCDSELDVQIYIKKNKELTIQIIELKTQVEELTNHLHKYTNGDNHKKYYEKNKLKIIENGASYLSKLKEENPDKLKEYRKTAYKNRKKKLLGKVEIEEVVVGVVVEVFENIEGKIINNI